jgi:hypothetical protein
MVAGSLSDHEDESSILPLIGNELLQAAGHHIPEDGTLQ